MSCRWQAFLGNLHTRQLCWRSLIAEGLARAASLRPILRRLRNTQRITRAFPRVSQGPGAQQQDEELPPVRAGALLRASLRAPPSGAPLPGSLGFRFGRRLRARRSVLHLRSGRVSHGVMACSRCVSCLFAGSRCVSCLFAGSRCVCTCRRSVTRTYDSLTENTPGFAVAATVERRDSPMQASRDWCSQRECAAPVPEFVAHGSLLPRPIQSARVARSCRRRRVEADAVLLLTITVFS